MSRLKLANEELDGQWNPAMHDGFPALHRVIEETHDFKLDAHIIELNDCYVNVRVHYGSKSVEEVCLVVTNGMWQKTFERALMEVVGNVREFSGFCQAALEKEKL